MVGIYHEGGKDLEMGSNLETQTPSPSPSPRSPAIVVSNSSKYFTTSNSGKALVASNSSKSLVVSDSGKALVLSSSGQRIDQSGKKKYVKQVTGRHNDTELHLAAQKGDVVAVREILGEINEQMLKTLSGAEFDAEVAEIRAAVVNEVNDLGETALFEAAEKGSIDVVKELMLYSAEEGITVSYNIITITTLEVRTISLFGEVWGIGPTTSKLYEKGNRTLDDLSNDESLTNAQMIGLRYFDDIKTRIHCQQVHFAATKDKLSIQFNKFGEVLKVIILTDPATGQQKDQRT